MKSAPLKFLILALILLAALGYFFWANSSKSSPKNAADTPSEVQTSSPRSREILRAGNSPESLGSAKSEIASHAEVTRLLDQCLAEFLASNSANESAEILQRLRDVIRSADEESATAAIVAFLKSKQDAPTKLPFSVGPEGMMETSPTLRIALLDLLPSLDPVAALDVAREIMDQKISPDEYALAIRNLAWNDLDGDLKNELNTRFQEMLNQENWRVEPSAGFLEALDAAVELTGEEIFSTMNHLHQDALTRGNFPLARASFMTLDRMIIRDPALLISAYTADPGLSQATADQRASLLSRLDITDPAQKAVFLEYLTATNHTPNELDYFIALFPNGNYLHGNWLITTNENTHSISSRLDEDRKVLAEISQLNLSGNAAKSLTRIRDRLIKISAQ